GSGADHAHGDGDKKLAFSEPARLLHEALLEERNDHEATAERERPRLEEERQELAEHGANGHVATAHHEERYADKERGRPGSRRGCRKSRCRPGSRGVPGGTDKRRCPRASPPWSATSARRPSRVPSGRRARRGRRSRGGRGADSTGQARGWARAVASAPVPSVILLGRSGAV